MLKVCGADAGSYPNWRPPMLYSVQSVNVNVCIATPSTVYCTTLRSHLMSSKYPYVRVFWL